MTSATVRPPVVAVWLVYLFVPYQQAESIPGDLLEEFSDLASKFSVAFARRWYWKQTVRTIVHLIGSGFRSGALQIVGAIVAGYVLLEFFGWSTEKAIVAIHYRYQVYAHIDAFVFWLIYAILVERLIEPILAGFIVALLARGREMIATMTMCLFISASSAVALLRAIKHFGWTAPFITQPLVLTTFVSPVLFVAGGGIARKIRLAAARRRAGA